MINTTFRRLIAVAILGTLAAVSIAVDLVVRVNPGTSLGVGSRVEISCDGYGYRSVILTNGLGVTFRGLPTNRWVWIKSTFFDGRSQVKWVNTGWWPYGTIYANFWF